jgi:hypothetical protein
LVFGIGQSDCLDGAAFQHPSPKGDEMKILLVAGALALAVFLAVGHPARPLDDLRWQRDQPYLLAPYATAKIGRPETPRQIAMASSSLQRR